MSEKKWILVTGASSGIGRKTAELLAQNGYEVYATLKPFLNTNRIPFVFLTASAQEKEISKAKQLGVDGYITKPFQSDVLFQTIVALLEKSRKGKLKSQGLAH